ncbi:MAG: hypothetical protein KA886_10580 [Candidatus Cloacimonetes bacterium]|nr:hypothetical protein [Candidatus Cloacimonadota bacterium]
MNNQLEILIQMQQIDDIIGQKDIIKNALPNQLSDLIHQVEVTESDMAKVMKDLEANLKKQKDKELEIKTNKDNIKKYEHQLDGIKNNKEYKALNSQISALKDKTGNFESELISIMDEESVIKEKKKVAETNRDLAKKALTNNEDKLKEEIVKVENDIAELKARRNSIAQQIPMSMVKKYAQLIKNKNRKAVVFCNGSSCGGCGFHIRPQLLIDIRQNDKINYCENCGRILALNPETK